MFHEQLRVLRKTIGLTQVQVANKLNMTQQAYAYYENGECEPNIDTIRKLCAIFDCTSDELLEIDSFKK